MDIKDISSNQANQVFAEVVTDIIPEIAENPYLGKDNETSTAAGELMGKALKRFLLKLQKLD